MKRKGFLLCAVIGLDERQITLAIKVKQMDGLHGAVHCLILIQVFQSL